MVLYEKHISPSGRISYREHVPSDAALTGDEVIETVQVITLLTTLVVSILISISEQMTPHAKITREIKLLEASVLRFAKLNGAPLDDSMIEVGIGAWNAAVRAIQQGLIRR